MLIKYPLQTDIPNDKIQPVSDNISPFALEALGFEDFLAEALHLAGCYWLSLGSVLFKILSDIIIVHILI